MSGSSVSNIHSTRSSCEESMTISVVINVGVTSCITSSVCSDLGIVSTSRVNNRNFPVLGLNSKITNWGCRTDAYTSSVSLYYHAIISSSAIICRRRGREVEKCTRVSDTPVHTARSAPSHRRSRIQYQPLIPTTRRPCVSSSRGDVNTSNRGSCTNTNLSIGVNCQTN